MNEQLIHTYLSGHATPGEQRELLEWLRESEENKRLFFEMKAVWSGLQTMDKLAESDRMQSSLRMLNEKIDRRAAHMIKPTVSKSSFAISGKWMLMVAAVILLILLPLTWILREGSTSDITQLYVTNRSNLVKVLYLPDGTKVWLNKNTSLIYPEKFSTKQREVILDGEAFFDVTKDKKHPFVVKTSSFNIKVLGTTFNVHSYKEDVQVSAVLESGVIQLQSAQGDALVTMHPGQQALYKPDTKELEVSYVAVNEHTSWRYNLVTLNNVTIHEVVKSLEENYQIKIQTDSVTLRDHRYNFTYDKGDSAEESVRMLQYVTGLNCKITKR